MKLLLATTILCSFVLQGCASSSIKSVNYYDKKEVTLSADVSLAKEKNAPTVILLHGCAGPTEPHISSWIKDLNSWGYNAVSLNSFSGRWVSSVCQNTFTIVPRLQRAYDAYYAAKWIKEQSWGGAKIAVIGFSHGAGGVLEMVNPNTIQQDFGNVLISAAVAYYPWCLSMSSRPGVVPTQLHLAGKDTIDPPGHCVGTAKGWGEKANVLVYDNASHGFDMPQVHTQLLTSYGYHLVSYSQNDDKLSRQQTKVFLDRQLK